MIIKYFNEIPFLLYKTVKTKKEAESIAERIRKEGYYVRKIKNPDGIEIWVSKNPRWFYRF